MGISGRETYGKGIVCVDGKESCGSRRRDTRGGRLLSMLDINAVKEALESKGKSPEK